MARKPNIQQTRSWRTGCLITIALLAAVLVFLKPAFGDGPKAYVGNFKDNTISVIDLELKRVTATIPIPPGPHGMVITPDNRWLYVASDGASTVSVIDTVTDKLVEAIGPLRPGHHALTAGVFHAPATRSGMAPPHL